MNEKHFVKPEKFCPICNKSWSKFEDENYILYSCNEGCNFSLKERRTNPSDWYCFRIFSSGFEIWWCDGKWCEIKKNINSVYMKLNFIIPFNITEGRIKKLLIFS